MHPLIPAWFFSQQPLTNFINRFNLSSSSLTSETTEDYRDISLSPTFVGNEYLLSVASHNQKFKVSHSVLLSSSLSLSSTIPINSYIVTKHGREEQRQANFPNLGYLSNSSSLVNYTGQKDTTIHLPNEPVTFQHLQKNYLIPNYSNGVLSVESLTSNVRTLKSAAWGLFLSCSINSTELVIAQLRELIRIAIAKNLLDNSTGQLLASKEDFWGFASLNVDDLSLTVNIEDNALLGYAIVCALHYLSNLSYLDNTLGSFLKDCIELARGFAYCCAESVSKVSGWCAGTHEDGYYDFFSLSLTSSFLSSLFFNSFLLLEYDSFIHEQAARLYLAIAGSPPNLEDNYYELFASYNLLKALGYRLWWLKEFSSANWIQEFLVYNDLKVSLTDSDYLVAALRYSLPNSPAWVTELLATNQEAYRLNTSTNLRIDLLAPLACAGYNYSLVVNSVFETFAYSAQAYTGFAREELIRMLPEGSEWSSSEIEEDRTTVLGGLLYAYSKSYFVWFLRYNLMRLPLLKSSGFLLRNLLKLLFPLAVNLSESVSKEIVSTLFLHPEISTQAKLTSLLHTEFERIYQEPAPFSAFDSFESNTYTSEEQEFNNNYLEESQYKAIAYNWQEVEKANQGQYGELTTIYQQLTLRLTPGFPYSTDNAQRIISGDKYVEPLEEYLPTVKLKTSTQIPSGLTSILGWVAPVGVSYLIEGELNTRLEKVFSIKANLGSYTLNIFSSDFKEYASPIIDIEEGGRILTEKTSKILTEKGGKLLIE